MNLRTATDGTPLDRGMVNASQSYLGHAADARLNLNTRLAALGPRSFDRLAYLSCSRATPGVHLAIFSEGTLGQQNAHDMIDVRAQVIQLRVRG